jgi:hypothetical protein
VGFEQLWSELPEIAETNNELMQTGILIGGSIGSALRDPKGIPHCEIGMPGDPWMMGTNGTNATKYENTSNPQVPNQRQLTKLGYQFDEGQMKKNGDMVWRKLLPSDLTPLRTTNRPIKMVEVTQVAIRWKARPDSSSTSMETIRNWGGHPRDQHRDRCPH